ncbi:hypothetical protein COY16_04000 [Candidatus Roizmanbacteria bacterium CG_4_10_14_0_2_um_filter_39_13]|uniref:LytR/CpsA/Psr regulator C-terminal domain-containing protein n=1 Tax=Candidatus Roizmanbacteria bacterium CG_4_10_14_0_2_um_filter_39_13 TaxID=1974825 RepID=A0A2M7TXL8_9BACT|nr:MAG: hypothetical protein COY16_04000 [Candidatus Roizmanbacteria bacterium CG_4_10_14_0_2_um_filter_39_13]
MKKIPSRYLTHHNKRKRIKIAVTVGAVLIFLFTTVVGGLIIRQVKNEQIKKSIVIEKKANTSREILNKRKENVTIQVLNGGGILGQVEVVVKTLEDAGYKSENITLADADSAGHKITTITSRADFKDIVINIKEILKPILPEIIDGALDTNPNEDSGFDVTVITGGKKIEAFVPTKTITRNPKISVSK